ncbi:MAG: Trm112 family protein [Ilumatobacteraceae bacterium]
MALDPRLLAVLACPVDKGTLYYLGDDEGLYNPRLRRLYLVRDGIPVMLPDEAVAVDDTTAARFDEQISSGAAKATGSG